MAIEIANEPKDNPGLEERSLEPEAGDNAGLALVQDELHPVQEQELVLNMGPQHPSTHGVLRVLLELDGEIVRKAIPDLGFLHRGIEKLGEYRMYNQFVPWTDRTDYIAAFTGNLAFVQTVEGLM